METPHLCYAMPIPCLAMPRDIQRPLSVPPSIIYSSSSLNPAVFRICSTSPFSALIFIKIFFLMI
jgi:hypothetical protein